MGTLVWRPAADAPIEVARIVVVDRVYTLEPGIPLQVPAEDYAAVRTKLLALQGTIVTPLAPTVAPVGTAGVETWGYKVVAVTQGGDSLPSPEGTTATGNAVLTAGHFNRVTRPTLPVHATGWRAIRNSLAGTPTGAPGTPVGTHVAGVTDLTAGDYKAKATYVDAFGQSVASPESVAVTASAGDTVTFTVTGVPTLVTSVRFYLTAGGTGVALGFIGAAVPAAGSAHVDLVLKATGDTTVPPLADTTGFTPHDVSGVLPASQTTFDDIGGAGTAYTAAGSNPSVSVVVAGPADE